MFLGSQRGLVSWSGPLFLLLFFATGCASYQQRIFASRELMESGSFQEAIEKLKPLAETPDGDQLVYLLDYGVALSLAGKIQESNSVLLRADKLAEDLDYHSVSRVAGSMVLSEDMKQYKGDTFEKIFINAYLAMNFLQLNQLDEALVEARRMNEKYAKIRLEDKKDFELNPFGKYLSALIWEADRKYDDAYIAYNEAYQISNEIGTIREDLIRSAKLSKRMNEYQKWKRAFPEVMEKDEWYSKNNGELVIIYQQGWGPRKAYNPQDYTFPILRPIPQQTTRAILQIDKVGSFNSTFIYDVESAAIKTLQDDMAALVARRIAARLTKDVTAEEIRKNNEILGLITWFALHISDRADLRQWSTLPQTIQVVRVYLPPGNYKFSLQGLNDEGLPTADQLINREVIIRSGKKSILTWRSVH